MKIKNYTEKSGIFQLIKLGRTLEQNLNNGLNEQQLSYFQALVLISISVEADKTLFFTDLHKVFPISKSALSQIISTLEKKKLLKRKIIRDRRKSLLALTSLGKDVSLMAMAYLEEMEQKFDGANFDTSMLINVNELIL